MELCPCEFLCVLFYDSVQYGTLLVKLVLQLNQFFDDDKAEEEEEEEEEEEDESGDGRQRRYERDFFLSLQFLEQCKQRPPNLMNAEYIRKVYYYSNK